MLARTFLIFALLIPLARCAAAPGQTQAEGVRVEVVATASEYVPRSTTVSHPGHAYTDCLGSTSYFGRFSSYGDSGSFSATGTTDTHCSTTFSPASETTLTTYRRVNYTIAKGDKALYLLSCTQTWKPTAKERALIAVMGVGEAGTGNNSAGADRAATNAKGKWSDCPAFGIGAEYTLTVRNTSDARLEDGSGKPMKLDYLSSAALPEVTAQSAQSQPDVPSVPPREAKVHVTSSPSGAEIYVDGKFFGNTPSDITLAAGEHTVKLATGGKEWSRPIQITSGEISLHAEISDREVGSRDKEGSEEKAESPKDRAVSQMRRIVAALRLCPTMSDSLPYMGAISKHTLTILDWDVVGSDSLLSPFQGVVHFKVDSILEETDEARRSKELDRQYHRSVEAIAARNFVEYRYEFTLGSMLPELRRALIFFPRIDADFRAYEPSPNSEGTMSCWDKIARSPELVVAKREIPKQQ